jgi:hypothetical protein
MHFAGMPFALRSTTAINRFRPGPEKYQEPPTTLQQRLAK